MQHLHTGLASEGVADLRMELHERVEHHAVEPECRHRLRRPHRRCPRRTLEERCLAEPVAGLKSREGDFLPFVDHERPRTAADEHVHAVGGVTLSHDRLAERERAALEQAHDEIPQRGLEPRKERQSFQSRIPVALGGGHSAPASRMSP